MGQVARLWARLAVEAVEAVEAAEGAAARAAAVRVDMNTEFISTPPIICTCRTPNRKGTRLTRRLATQLNPLT